MGPKRMVWPWKTNSLLETWTELTSAVRQRKVPGFLSLTREHIESVGDVIALVTRIGHGVLVQEAGGVAWRVVHEAWVPTWDAWGQFHKQDLTYSSWLCWCSNHYVVLLYLWRSTCVKQAEKYVWMWKGVFLDCITWITKKRSYRGSVITVIC